MAANQTVTWRPQRGWCAPSLLHGGCSIVGVTYVIKCGCIYSIYISLSSLSRMHATSGSSLTNFPTTSKWSYQVLSWNTTLSKFATLPHRAHYLMSTSVPEKTWQLKHSEAVGPAFGPQSIQNLLRVPGQQGKIRGTQTGS